MSECVLILSDSTSTVDNHVRPSHCVKELGRVILTDRINDLRY